MKKIIIPFLCFIIIGIVLYKSEDITNFISNKVTSSPKIIIPPKNNYAKDASFKYVQLTDDFVPYSYQDLKNILYTIMNNGWESFTFYCPSEYTSCLDDIENLSYDQVTLTYINDFVDPFNSFDSIKISFASNGEIIISPNYLYSKQQIEEIENKVNELINNSSVVSKSSSTPKDIIKYFHDYIINNTKYDVNYEKLPKEEQKKSSSRTAYGAFFTGKAICNGYADAMAIILDKLGIENFRIATPEKHIWNAVKLDGVWYHLDLTWDDPVASDGKDYLFYNYFLINTEKLKKVDSGSVQIEDHDFDDTVYLEFNSLM